LFSDIFFLNNDDSYTKNTGGNNNNNNYLANEAQNNANSYLEPQAINWNKPADNYLTGKKPLKGKKYAIKQ
jgi:hypothetical protein